MMYFIWGNAFIKIAVVSLQIRNSSIPYFLKYFKFIRERSADFQSSKTCKFFQNVHERQEMNYDDLLPDIM